MQYSYDQTGVDDGWPWDCTRCGTTIYHDEAICRDCDRSLRAADPDVRAARTRSLVRWTRRQSYLSFLTKVSTVAGVEVGLTALWLEVLFRWSLAVPSVPA